MILEGIIKAIVPYIVHFLELIGIFIIAWSAVRVFYRYLKNIKNPKNTPLKIEFAEALSFALDFKLASEIIKTVVIKNMSELYVLGAVVGLRVILTLVLQLEIKSGKGEKNS